MNSVIVSLANKTVLHIQVDDEVLSKEVFLSKSINPLDITSVIITGNIKKLGHLLFEDCFNLKNVTLNDGLTTLGWQCFKNCISLKELILPESVSSIFDLCFQNCISLSLITILGIPTFIKTGYGAQFYNCFSLKEIRTNKKYNYATDKRYGFKQAVSETDLCQFLPPDQNNISNQSNHKLILDQVSFHVISVDEDRYQQFKLANSEYIQACNINRFDGIPSLVKDSFQSHVSLIQKLIQKEVKYSFIFEDDSVPVISIEVFKKYLEEIPENILNDFEIILFGWSGHKNFIEKQRFDQKFNRIFGSKFSGAHSYLISRRGMEHYLEIAKKLENTPKLQSADGIFKFFDKVYCTDNVFFVQRNFNEKPSLNKHHGYNFYGDRPKLVDIQSIIFQMNQVSSFKL